MYWLKTFFSFYIKSSIHVALAVVSLAAITVETYRLEHSATLLIFIFCSALSAYNFIKFFEMWKPSKRHFFKAHPVTSVLTLIATFIALGLTLLLPPKSLIFLTIGGLVVIIYSLGLPFLRNSLREQNGLKIVWVAMSWVLLTVFVPLSLNETFIWKAAFQMGFIQWGFVMVATLPFEIRDINSDAKDLGTWPQLLGIENTKWLGSFIILVGALLSGFWFDQNLAFLFSSWIIFFVLLIVLWVSETDQPFYFASFGVEALPIFWWACLHVFLNQ